ncbi:ribonuclease H-like domain-containing protein [Collybia nuda]|uniref:Ribonuclease H-like domain-containing protein n=1 Tax=Collybia nuda TaxID=64659 RepID=A0A9P5XTT4_9AGAR|nr:ribonuclease H-like domain-containing protein [Collybia nuda]
MERLVGQTNLTYLMDGWDDAMRKSVYGCMVVEVGEYPVVLGLHELTGMWGTADTLVEVSNQALAQKDIDVSAIIAGLACFMHGINTIVGKIAAWPRIKETISKNSCIVTFFNSSHYWGGQLQNKAKAHNITRKLKTNTESWFYALVLQAMSIQEHRTTLTEICNLENAQDVVMTVFDLSCWDYTDQLIRICKPLVDVIGDTEGRDATLADCMLQLIWAHHEIIKMQPHEGDDAEFTHHARQVLNLHWFALFLHPLCQKLAISSAVHSRKLQDAYRIAADIAFHWEWSRNQAEQLMADIKSYFHGQAPFQGGIKDGREWWKSLLVSATNHPLKALAIKIFSIVPHAAEVERFFSNLGGVQSVKRSQLTIPHLETLGVLRNHYTRKIHEAALKMGKSGRWKHAHMHTQEEAGTDLQRAEMLLGSFTLPAPLNTGFNDASLNSPESITDEEIAAEFDKLDEQLFATEDGDRLAPDVPLNQVFDLTDLDSIRNGSGVAITIEEEMSLNGDGGSMGNWAPESLLQSLGI